MLLRRVHVYCFFRPLLVNTGKNLCMLQPFASYRLALRKKVLKVITTYLATETICFDSQTICFDSETICFNSETSRGRGKT